MKKGRDTRALMPTARTPGIHRPHALMPTAAHRIIKS
jgi:hypothetical protein